MKETNKLLALEGLLKTLIEINPNEDLILSGYLRLQRSSEETVRELRERFLLLQKYLSPSQKSQVASAWPILNDYCQTQIQPGMAGVALFWRGGQSPFFHQMQFATPLPDWLVLDHTPRIIPLVEMKDNYDRYVVLISKETEARIFEIALGEISRRELLHKPELRKRLGREWTREHYHNHQHNRQMKFLKEKIALVEKIFQQGGHSHLILAGHPANLARIREQLPKNLRERLLDSIKLPSTLSIEQILLKTVESFVAAENRQSQQALDLLQNHLLSDGPAVAGLRHCTLAMQNGLVDMLIVSGGTDNYQATSSTPRPHKSKIDSSTFGTIEKARESLVQDAIRFGCAIEFLDPGTFLDDFEGVGAILRYRGGERWLRQLAEETDAADTGQNRPEQLACSGT